MDDDELDALLASIETATKSDDKTRDALRLKQEELEEQRRQEAAERDAAARRRLEEQKKKKPSLSASLLGGVSQASFRLSVAEADRRRAAELAEQALQGPPPSMSAANDASSAKSDAGSVKVASAHPGQLSSAQTAGRPSGEPSMAEKVAVFNSVSQIQRELFPGMHRIDTGLATLQMSGSEDELPRHAVLVAPPHRFMTLPACAGRLHGNREPEGSAAVGTHGATAAAAGTTKYHHPHPAAAASAPASNLVAQLHSGPPARRRLSSGWGSSAAVDTVRSVQLASRHSLAAAALPTPGAAAAGGAAPASASSAASTISVSHSRMGSPTRRSMVRANVFAVRSPLSSARAAAAAAGGGSATRAGTHSRLPQPGAIDYSSLSSDGDARNASKRYEHWRTALSAPRALAAADDFSPSVHAAESARVFEAAYCGAVTRDLPVLASEQARVCSRSEPGFASLAAAAYELQAHGGLAPAPCTLLSPSSGLPAAQGAPINILPCLLPGSSAFAAAASAHHLAAATAFAPGCPAAVFRGFPARLAAALGLLQRVLLPPHMPQKASSAPAGESPAVEGYARKADADAAAADGSLLGKRVRVAGEVAGVVTQAPQEERSSSHPAALSAADAAGAPEKRAVKRMRFADESADDKADAAPRDSKRDGISPEVLQAAVDALVADPVGVLACTIGCGYGYGLHSAQLRPRSIAAVLHLAQQAKVHDNSGASPVPGGSFVSPPTGQAPRASASLWAALRPALAYPVDAAFLSASAGVSSGGGSSATTDELQGLVSSGSDCLMLSLSHRLQSVVEGPSVPGHSSVTHEPVGSFSAKAVDASSRTLSSLTRAQFMLFPRWLRSAASEVVAQSLEPASAAGLSPLRLREFVPAGDFIACVHALRGACDVGSVPAAAAAAPGSVGSAASVGAWPSGAMAWLTDGALLHAALASRLLFVQELIAACELMSVCVAKHAVTLQPAQRPAATAGTASSAGGWTAPSYAYNDAELRALLHLCTLLLVDPVVCGAIGAHPVAPATAGASDSASDSAGAGAGAGAGKPVSHGAIAVGGSPAGSSGPGLLSSGFTSITALPPRDLAEELVWPVAEGLIAGTVSAAAGASAGAGTGGSSSSSPVQSDASSAAAAALLATRSAAGSQQSACGAILRLMHTVADVIAWRELVASLMRSPEPAVQAQEAFTGASAAPVPAAASRDGAAGASAATGGGVAAAAAEAAGQNSATAAATAAAAAAGLRGSVAPYLPSLLYLRHDVQSSAAGFAEALQRVKGSQSSDTASALLEASRSDNAVNSAGAAARKSAGDDTAEKPRGSASDSAGAGRGAAPMWAESVAYRVTEAVIDALPPNPEGTVVVDGSSPIGGRPRSDSGRKEGGQGSNVGAASSAEAAMAAVLASPEAAPHPGFMPYRDCDGSIADAASAPVFAAWGVLEHAANTLLDALSGSQFPRLHAYPAGVAAGTLSLQAARARPSALESTSAPTAAVASAAAVVPAPDGAAGAAPVTSGSAGAAAAGVPGSLVHSALSLVCYHAEFNSQAPLASVARALAHAAATSLWHQLENETDAGEDKWLLPARLPAPSNKRLEWLVKRCNPMDVEGEFMAALQPWSELSREEQLSHLVHVLAAEGRTVALPVHRTGKASSSTIAPAASSSSSGSSSKGSKSGGTARGGTSASASASSSATATPAVAAVGSAAAAPPPLSALMRRALSSAEDVEDPVRLSEELKAATAAAMQARQHAHTATVWGALAMFQRLLHALALLRCRVAPPTAPVLPEFIGAQIEALAVPPPSAGSSDRDRASSSAAAAASLGGAPAAPASDSSSRAGGKKKGKSEGPQARRRNISWFLSSTGDGSVIGSFPHPLLLPGTSAVLSLPTLSAADASSSASSSSASAASGSANVATGSPSVAVLLQRVLSLATLTSCHPHPVPCSYWPVAPTAGAGAGGGEGGKASASASAREAQKHPAARLREMVRKVCLEGTDVRRGEMKLLPPAREEFRAAARAFDRFLASWYSDDAQENAERLKYV